MASAGTESLVLVQDFVNTIDIGAASEELGSPEALRAWLAGHGLPVRGRVTRRDHARAIEMREAIRRLLLANNGAELNEADLDVLNVAATDARLCPRFLASGQARLEPEDTGTIGALGQIVASVSEAMADRSWLRLKACADDGCRWAFIDQSKNRSGHWCSMDVCGNRAKARHFRLRHRAQS